MHNTPAVDENVRLGNSTVKETLEPTPPGESEMAHQLLGSLLETAIQER